MTGGARYSLLKRMCNFIAKCYHTPSIFDTRVAPKNTQSNLFTIKVDSGASRHFIREEDRNILKQLKTVDKGPRAVLPNKKSISPTHTGALSLHQRISRNASSALVYPDISNESLLSVGQLCDDGCLAVFTDEHVYITKQNELLLKGDRNTTDGLWDIPLKKECKQDSTSLKLNYIIQKNKTKYELAHYLHACAFSPVILTFQEAIRKGNFVTWPGIGDINFQNVVGTTMATEKGHLKQEKQGLQSTTAEQAVYEDSFPATIKQKTSSCFATITKVPTKRTTYIDQTGKFPYQSSRGNQYLFVLYDYDANCILFEPIKNRTGESITKAWKKCHEKLTKHGHTTDMYILDNEMSPEIKQAFDNAKVKY